MVGLNNFFGGGPASSASGAMASKKTLEEEYADRQELVRGLVGQLLQEVDRMTADNARLVKELQERDAAGGGTQTEKARQLTAQPPRSLVVEQSEEVPPQARESQIEKDDDGEASPREDLATHRRTRDSRVMQEGVEAEDFYENLYDLTRAFHTLCPSHKATIGAKDLVDMSANQQGLDPLDVAFVDVRPKFHKALASLNQEFGVVSVKTGRPSKDINLDTFLAIMQRNEAKIGRFLEEADEETKEVIMTIRDILVREDALRKVAKATNMEVQDIYMISKPTLRPSRLDRVIHYMDPIIGLVIILNAIVIGVSTDYLKDSDLWTGFELAFTVIFFGEVMVKLIGFGPYVFFLGPEWTWNWFDTCVVVMAVFDLVFTLLGEVVELGNFTIVRLLRFARLTKLIRVLKVKMFKELALLVNGILAGFRTLIWAIVFLAFILFGLGVLLTQIIGQQDDKYWEEICNDMDPETELGGACVNSAFHFRFHRRELFGDVPRSMFTVFRCFTDGCGTADGSPLIPYVYNTMGVVPVIVYMLVTLFVMFGLFNLIMAVFVENTIENAKHEESRRKEARNNEHLRIAKKLQEAIVMFCAGHEEDEIDPIAEAEEARRRDTFMRRNRRWFRKLFGTRHENNEGHGTLRSLRSMHPANDSGQAFVDLSIQVNHGSFMRILHKPEVQEMLDDLDIGITNRNTLFDVLDANCNGSLEVSELVQGLLKLRGQSDKGDIIASLLGIRSMQKTLKAMELLGLHQQDSIERLKHNQEKLQASIENVERWNPWHRASQDAERADTGSPTGRADWERKLKAVARSSANT